MKKHDADIIADKITNYLSGVPGIKQAWFDLEPEERNAIEDHISEMIRDAVKDLQNE